MIVIQACQGIHDNLILQPDSSDRQINHVDAVEADVGELSALSPKAADMVIALASMKGKGGFIYTFKIYIYIRK